MHSPGVLLKALAKSAVNAMTGGVLDFALEVVPSIARDVWEWWSRDRSEAQRRADIEELAQAPTADYREQVAQVVAEEAGDRPVEIQLELTSFLSQVPAAIRQTLRRPSDPAGKTIPSTLRLNQAEDLQRLLPQGKPRFKVGDRPIPNVDWELVELLGVGGFGEVWKAHNPLLDGLPPVALKFCLDAEARKVLRHEAQVLNQVMKHGRHPGVVPLLHAYLSCDPPCLEYEYVSGGDLAGLLRDRPAENRGLPPSEATSLIQNLAEIVGHFHRLDPPIIHRDLKPANILLAGGARDVRITDFGIGGVMARQVITGTIGAGTRTRMPTLVRDGAYTPLYASPQQIRGEPPDPRDDVHALGVIWYQLLMGDLNSGAPAGFRWAESLRRRGMLDAEVELLASCFEADPTDRPADARVLAETLTGLRARESSPPARSVPPPELSIPLTQESPAVPGRISLPALPEGVRELQERYRRLESSLRQLEASAPALSEGLRQRLAEELQAKPQADMAHFCGLAPAVPRSVLVPYLQQMREATALRAQLLPRLEEDLLILLPEFFAANRQEEFPLAQWIEWEPFLMHRYAGWEPAAMQRHAEKGYRALWEQWCDEQNWRAACSLDTEQAYADYLGSSANWCFRVEAQDHVKRKREDRDDATYRDARQQDDVAGYRRYLKDWGHSGRHVAETNEQLARLHNLDWHNTVSQDTAEAYIAYCDRWPEEQRLNKGREEAAGRIRNRLMTNLRDRELRRSYLRLRSHELELLDRRYAYWRGLLPAILVTLGGFVPLVLTALLCSGSLLVTSLVGGGLAVLAMRFVFADGQYMASWWGRLGPLPLLAYFGSVERARQTYLGEIIMSGGNSSPEPLERLVR